MLILLCHKSKQAQEPLIIGHGTEMKICVNIMKEGKVKKARRKDSPKPAEPQSGARRTVKLLPGAEALAKPLPRKRAAPTSTRTRSVLKPLKTLQSHISGVLGLPRPAPNLL